VPHCAALQIAIRCVVITGATGLRSSSGVAAKTELNENALVADLVAGFLPDRRRHGRSLAPGFTSILGVQLWKSSRYSARSWSVSNNATCRELRLRFQAVRLLPILSQS
jgi:hypothetical protein